MILNTILWQKVRAWTKGPLKKLWSPPEGSLTPQRTGTLENSKDNDCNQTDHGGTNTWAGLCLCYCRSAKTELNVHRVEKMATSEKTGSKPQRSGRAPILQRMPACQEGWEESLPSRKVQGPESPWAKTGCQEIQHPPETWNKMSELLPQFKQGDNFIIWYPKFLFSC